MSGQQVSQATSWGDNTLALAWEHAPVKPLAVVAGGLVLWGVLNTMPINAVAYPTIATALVAFGAGWIARRRSALAGFACVLVASLLWFVQVLVRSWLNGDLARTFPDCDPCGLAGYTVRMSIVTLIGLGTFGVLSLVAGWLGGFVRRRSGR